MRFSFKLYEASVWSGISNHNYWKPQFTEPWGGEDVWTSWYPRLTCCYKHTHTLLEGLLRPNWFRQLVTCRQRGFVRGGGSLASIRSSLARVAARNLVVKTLQNLRGLQRFSQELPHNLWQIDSTCNLCVQAQNHQGKNLWELSTWMGFPRRIECAEIRITSCSSHNRTTC